jgi:hypothetical protein
LIDFLTACPPEAQSLPLSSRKVGMSRRQLYNQPTTIVIFRVGRDVAAMLPWPTTSIHGAAEFCRYPGVAHIDQTNASTLDS